MRGRFIEALVRRAGIDCRRDGHPLLPEPGHRAYASTAVVVMHHGHFVERLYRIMSGLDDIFDRPQASRTVVDLESDNAGWIDFFWSSEGDLR